MASSNYDPVKAHEYYEKHKQLKGREKKSTETTTSKSTSSTSSTTKNSTKGLNEEGRAAAKACKEKLKEEKAKELEKLKEKVNKEIEKLKRRIELYKMSTKDSAVLAATAGKLQEDIAKIRSDYTDKKAQIKESYDAKYTAELEKIKSNKNYQTEKKTKKKKTTTKKSTSTSTK